MRTADIFSFIKNGTDSVYDDFAVLMLTNSELELVAKKEGTFDFEDIKYSGLMETVLKHIVSAESAAGGHLQQSEYMKNFEKRNPNLIVFNAVMHLDEATPHLHISFVPVAHNQKRGLETRIFM